MNTGQRLAYGMLGAPLAMLLMRWRPCLEVKHAV